MMTAAILVFLGISMMRLGAWLTRSDTRNRRVDSIFPRHFWNQLSSN